MSEHVFTFGGSDESSNEGSERGSYDGTTEEDDIVDCPEMDDGACGGDVEAQSLAEKMDETQISDEAFATAFEAPCDLSKEIMNSGELSELTSRLNQSVVLCESAQAKEPVRRKPRIALVKKDDSNVVEPNVVEPKGVKAKQPKVVEPNGVKAKVEKTKGVEPKGVKAKQPKVVEQKETKVVEQKEPKVVEQKETKVVEQKETKVVEQKETKVVEQKETKVVEQKVVDQKVEKTTFPLLNNHFPNVEFNAGTVPETAFQTGFVFTHGKSDSSRVVKQGVRKSTIASTGASASFFPQAMWSGNNFERKETVASGKSRSASEEPSDSSDGPFDRDFRGFSSTPKTSQKEEIDVKPKRRIVKTVVKQTTIPHTYSTDVLKEDNLDEFSSLYQQLLNDEPFASLTLNGKPIESVPASDKVKPCRAETITSKFFMMRKLPSHIRIFGVKKEDIDYRTMTRSSMQVFKNGTVIETKYLSDLVVPSDKKPDVNTSEADLNAFLFFKLWNLPPIVIVRDNNDLNAGFKVIGCVPEKRV